MTKTENLCGLVRFASRAWFRPANVQKQCLEFLSNPTTPTVWSHVKNHSVGSSPPAMKRKTYSYWEGTCCVISCRSSSVIALVFGTVHSGGHSPYATAPCNHMFWTKKCPPVTLQDSTAVSDHPLTIGRAGQVDKNPTPVCLPPQELVAFDL